MHAHNTFPLFSPSVFGAAKTEGVRTIMTAHNFRIFCSNGLMLRDGKNCDSCLTKNTWQGVRYKCYRDSVTQSLLMRRLIETHRKKNTWKRDLDTLIVLNPFAQESFVKFGFDVAQLNVVPNFALEPTVPAREERSRSVLYLGRWSAEKGILKLLQAWGKTGLKDLELRIAGSGPEENRVLSEVRRLQAEGFRIQTLGQLGAQEVSRELSSTSALVFPSLCHENFPLSIVEAFAHETPVLASSTGSLGWILGDTNVAIDPHLSPEELALQLRIGLSDSNLLRRQGRAGRDRYLANFTAKRHLELLLAIYRGKSHG
jgi:glycosyltransferase involved in cell wall biosynthesis